MLRSILLMSRPPLLCEEGNVLSDDLVKLKLSYYRNLGHLDVCPGRLRITLPVRLVNEKLHQYMFIEKQAARGALAFIIPVLVVLVLTFHTNYYFLAAGPLCGIVGGLAYGRRWGLPIILGTCFGVVGILFALQDTRSALFIDVVCASIGLVTGPLYFVRYRLPLGLFNSLSPASVASDWLFGWSVLAAVIGALALMKKFARAWATSGVVLAFVLLVASYRVEADPWKTQFNTSYAEKLLREQGQPGDPEYGDAVYTGNLILSQTALDKNDLAAARRYLLRAAATPGARSIEQNGLDTSVARVFLQRGERDAVLDYFNQTRHLWPQGSQLITRWEDIIRSGRIPNFNNRGPLGIN